MKTEFQVLIPESGMASEIVERIDEGMYAQVKRHCDNLERFFDSYLGYWIFQSNVESFEKYILADHSKLLLPSSLSEIEREVAKIQLNRIFLNLLSSFRSFIDHAETSIARQDAKLMTAFKSAQSAEYDSNDHYRLFWELRNFSQHCALPISGYKIDVVKSQNRLRFKTQLIPTIQSKHLLKNWDKWKPQVKQWLDSNSEIPARELIYQVRECVLRIQASFLDRDKASVKEAHDFLTNFKSKFNLKERSVELYFIENGKPKERISVSHYKMIVAKSFLADQKPLSI